ncbi:MAG TPA: Hpt domain-containing protein [Blastocatellia bacterium]|nr:Hpt domain-containing protein [Blastocatellia bacterium]
MHNESIHDESIHGAAAIDLFVTAIDLSVAPIDLSVLAGLREFDNEGDPDLVAELAVIFFQDTVERLESLRRAIDSADAAGIENEAHSLKGSSASLGAVGMSLLCSELELQGRAGSIEGAGALEGASEALTQIEEEFGRARAFLEAEIYITV